MESTYERNYKPELLDVCLQNLAVEQWGHCSIANISIIIQFASHYVQSPGMFKSSKVGGKRSSKQAELLDRHFSQLQ